MLVWRIEDFKPVPVPKEFYGEFFSGDSYVLLNSYKSSDGYVIAVPRKIKTSVSPIEASDHHLTLTAGS